MSEAHKKRRPDVLRPAVVPRRGGPPSPSRASARRYQTMNLARRSLDDLSAASLEDELHRRIRATAGLEQIALAVARIVGGGRTVGRAVDQRDVVVPL